MVSLCFLCFYLFLFHSKNHIELQLILRMHFFLFMFDTYTFIRFFKLNVYLSIHGCIIMQFITDLLLISAPFKYNTHKGSTVNWDTGIIDVLLPEQEVKTVLIMMSVSFKFVCTFIWGHVWKIWMVKYVVCYCLFITR